MVLDYWNNITLTVYSSRSQILYVWPYISEWYVTRIPSMEKAVTIDMYYKGTSTIAFAWTLPNITTYVKNIKFLMLLVKSSILGTILNTQNLQETTLYLNLMTLSVHRRWHEESKSN
jgi:hypothetical protein